RTMPAASGCRAMASTDLPIRTPIPMPGPMAASPYTRPLPMAATSPVVSATKATMWVMTPIMYPSLGSVLLRDRTGDVRGGEHGENERLQAGAEALGRGHQGPHG